MITGFAASGEDQVMCNLVTTTKSIVEVNTCAWAVEKNITFDGRLRGFCMNVKAILLLIKSNFTHSVAQNRSIARVFSIGSINSSIRVIVTRGFIRITPASHCRSANILKVGVLHGRETIIPTEHHSV